MVLGVASGIILMVFIFYLFYLIKLNRESAVHGQNLTRDKACAFIREE